MDELKPDYKRIKPFYQILINVGKSLLILNEPQWPKKKYDENADIRVSINRETGEYESANALLAEALPQARKSANQITHS